MDDHGHLNRCDHDECSSLTIKNAQPRDEGMYYRPAKSDDIAIAGMTSPIFFIGKYIDSIPGPPFSNQLC